MTQSEFQTVDILTHYVTYAQRPGCKDYVWHRVNQMAREHPDLYLDLPAQLKVEMLALKPPSEPTVTLDKPTVVEKPLNGRGRLV